MTRGLLGLIHLLRHLLRLLHEAERTLLRLVSESNKATKRLLTRRHLLAAHYPAPLVLNEILSCKTTRRMFRASVKDLRLATNSHSGLLHICF